jgi:hypothetical protein
MGEAYVIIIIASMPLMNSLVKWGKETISQRSYRNSNNLQTKVTIKQSWTVEHEDSDDAKPSDQGSKDCV